MKLPIKESVLKKALEQWGDRAQEGMAIEECSEFIDSMMKRYRGRVDDKAVAEEVADVLIVMSQMRLVFGAGLVDSFIIKKMARLEGLLGG